MFYLNKSVLLQKDLKFVQLPYHAINQIRVDFINKEIEVQIASFKDMENLQYLMADNILSFMFNYTNYDFNSDVCMNCLKMLSIMPDNIFMGATIEEIKLKELENV